MIRSLSFGSNIFNSLLFLKLVFTSLTFFNFNLLKILTHWPIMQKVRYLWPKFNCSFDIQFQTHFTTTRGSFHLSFTVLIHYRLIKIFKIRRWFSWTLFKIKNIILPNFILNFKQQDIPLSQLLPRDKASFFSNTYI